VCKLNVRAIEQQVLVGLIVAAICGAALWLYREVRGK
jgi:hypothetical protein